MAAAQDQNKSLPSLRNLTSNFGKVSDQQHKALQDLIRPHIESFNFILEEGLSLAVQGIYPQEFLLRSGQKATIYFTDASVGVPLVSEKNLHASQLKVFPSECRQRGTTYRAKLQVTLQWKIDDQPQGNVTKVIGNIPIMVKSKNCSLAGLSAKELVVHHEEAEEAGGYFIINGIEKIIRMLILPRRNFPMAISRPSWKNKGPLFTEYGVQMRSVKQDQTASNMVLHYQSDGGIMISINFKKELFFIPLVFILKALVNTTDQRIYRELVKGEQDNTFLKDCVATMLRTAQTEGVYSQQTILKYIGERFRVKMYLPEWYTDEAVAKCLIRECVCIHLEANLDKFNLLIFMARKLYALALEKCAVESADSPMMQEVLLGGHLYLMCLKEKLDAWLYYVRTNIEKESTSKPTTFEINTANLLQAMGRAASISHQMEYLLATGNLISRTGLGLLQVSGFSVVADRLNFYRFLSHFRCVHRGSFFSQMRTTAVRKLLPESWGFLCPVHTPDGAPCGLLNHMTESCQVVNVVPHTVHLHRLLCSLGMTPYDTPPLGEINSCYTVLMDGKVLGRVDMDLAPSLVNRLRMCKVMGLEKVPQCLEICLVPITRVASQYPALYIFSTVARMMRPVLNLAAGKIEMIGTFEQVYMNIAIVREEVHEGETTHLELKPTNMLSAVASLTPFSDFNQSPRNMYQCQMGKQTMGTPAHALKYRGDNKLYRIQTPQSPLVRPAAHDQLAIDNYAHGTNAVVAVISYTGYDMEDAMILNKASFERGFAHGSVYKSEIIDLKKIAGTPESSSLRFGCLPGDERCEGFLDPDGLPPIGTKLETGSPLYCYVDENSGQTFVKNYSSLESAYVDQVRILGNDDGTSGLDRVSITLRIQRNPIIGDKFSSRHGQKGICSQKWPIENMPFTECGMTPDIIFNPHGFPSRMTIGMMIESMAGKSAGLNGVVFDATPFTFNEDDPAIDYFGNLLKQSGFNYYGTERMYSGTDGREFEADIFFGIVYYQRLRHMVADKYQVRTTGPIDILTHQPVQGRKRQGGIRFGEMERDALLAHGTSFLLQDRLMNCSDRTLGHVCTKCGSILSPLMDRPAADVAAAAAYAERKWTCRSCESSDHIDLLAFPYVFRYLVAELAGMNIKVSLDMKRVGK